MVVRLQKWGNSHGIWIPSNILKTLNFKVDLRYNDDRIVIFLAIPLAKFNVIMSFNNYCSLNNNFLGATRMC